MGTQKKEKWTQEKKKIKKKKGTPENKVETWKDWITKPSHIPLFCQWAWKTGGDIREKEHDF